MRVFLFLFIVLLSFPALAQEEGPILIDEIPEKITSHPDDKFITVVFENDSIGRGSDQNYTNGVRLTYFDLNAEFPDIAHKIASFVPTFSINRTSSVYYSFGQNLYTPDNIESRAQDPRERPWAAFLYGSIGMATLTKNHIDELEATLGIVGPWAFGEGVQKAVHKHITDSPVPQGWSNQLSNEPGLILSWQRRWPKALRHNTPHLTLSAAPYFGTSLGNVYTYVNAGFSFRVSSSQSQWTDTPVRIRPALAGTGFFDLPEKKWDWYLFGGFETRAVARNIFLDGNTFSNSHDVNKIPLVGDSNAGIAFTIGATRLSYTLTYRTKEFTDQDKGDLFGSASLSYRF